MIFPCIARFRTSDLTHAGEQQDDLEEGGDGDEDSSVVDASTPPLPIKVQSISPTPVPPSTDTKDLHFHEVRHLQDEATDSKTWISMDHDIPPLKTEESGRQIWIKFLQQAATDREMSTDSLQGFQIRMGLYSSNNTLLAEKVWNRGEIFGAEKPIVAVQGIKASKVQYAANADNWIVIPSNHDTIARAKVGDYYRLEYRLGEDKKIALEKILWRVVPGDFDEILFDKELARRRVCVTRYVIVIPCQPSATCVS